MAKKKMQKRGSLSQSLPQEDAREQLASLRTLNNLLVRETVERREQIAEAAAKAWDLEAEKSACLDNAAASEVEQGILAVVVALELGRLKEEVKGKVAVSDARVADTLREKEETERALAEKETMITDLWKEAGKFNAELQLGREALDVVLHERDAARAELARQKEETERLMLKATKLQKKKKFGYGFHLLPQLLLQHLLRLSLGADTKYQFLV